MSEVKKCPKCGGEMERGTLDVLLGMHIVSKRGSKIRAGDKVSPYYCMNCGYVELYKEMKEKKE